MLIVDLCLYIICMCVCMCTCVYTCVCVRACVLIESIWTDKQTGQGGGGGVNGGGNEVEAHKCSMHTHNCLVLPVPQPQRPTIINLPSSPRDVPLCVLKLTHVTSTSVSHKL